MAPIPGFLYNLSKDVFLYLKGKRKDIKDLVENISELTILLCSINSRETRIDRCLAGAVTTEASEEYIVMKKEIELIHNRYIKFINKYSRITSNIPSLTTDELNISTLSLMTAKLNDLKTKIATFNFFTLADLSTDIGKLSTRASKLLVRLEPKYMTQKKLELDQEKWNQSNDLPVFNTYVDAVLEYLCDEGNKVGIFGCFGVGKTTVMRRLYNRLIEQKSLSADENSSHHLEHIIFVEYPVDNPETGDEIVEKLQREIMVHLDIYREATPSQSVNADIISTFLRYKKYIFLMDHVSDCIDLDELGLLREHHVSKKVVIASSVKLVITDMTDHEVIVSRLEKDDAWTLFQNICGTVHDSRKKEIADRIIECCGGIPWMIRGIASYLKDKKDDSSWNSAKQILQSDARSIDLIELQGIDKVYELKYSELQPETKKCLLYGALFPNQYEIYTDYLVECWIAEGFIVQDVDQEVRAKRDHGQTVLNHLTDRHMLEWCSGKKYIKMPPYLRRVALELPYPDENGCKIWVPKDRKPDDSTWATVTRMSLIGCNKAELPTCPKCCNICTLLLQLKPNLERLEDKFFEHMEGLRVLDLNHTEIEALPNSISKLKNLKSLYLTACHNLVALPDEADKLLKLEFLDICGTSISSLPKQIRHMADLRCLRASFPVKRHNHNSKGKEVEDLDSIIPSGIISNLEKLEELSIDTTFEIAVAERLARELANLEYLTTLSINFPNVSSVNTFVDQSKSLKKKNTSWETQTLRSFKIFIGSHETQHPYESDISGILAERWLRHSTNEEFSSACKELLKQASAFEIIGHDGVKSLSCSQFELNSVKVCVVERCNKLKNIVDGYIASEKQGIAKQSLLQNLEKLYLYNLQSLKFIWVGPVPSNQSLTNLTTIAINGCPNLRNIFDVALAHTLQSLQYLKVENCSAITEIVGMSANTGREGHGRSSEIEAVHEESSYNSEQGDQSGILKSLRKIELSDLPELQSICNSTSISWNSLNSIIVMRCMNLSNLSLTGTNARKLALIRGEENWWNTLEFSGELNQRPLPFSPSSNN